jgi:hypothetical protein
VTQPDRQRPSPNGTAGSNASLFRLLALGVVEIFGYTFDLLALCDFWATMSDTEAEAATPQPPQFSSNFPQGCPPAGAPFAWGTVFRIVRSNPLVAEDFKTWYEEGKQARSGRECDAHGLSVFREFEDASSYSDRYPYLGSLIAQAELSDQHGKIAPTPREFEGVTYTHETWWPFDGLERHALFVVAPEEE